MMMGSILNANKCLAGLDLLTHVPNLSFFWSRFGSLNGLGRSPWYEIFQIHFVRDQKMNRLKTNRGLFGGVYMYMYMYVYVYIYVYMHIYNIFTSIYIYIDIRFLYKWSHCHGNHAQWLTKNHGGEDHQQMVVLWQGECHIPASRVHTLPPRNPCASPEICMICGLGTHVAYVAHVHACTGKFQKIGKKNISKLGTWGNKMVFPRQSVAIRKSDATSFIVPINYSHPQIDSKVNHHWISRNLLFHLFGDDYLVVHPT